MDTHTRAENVLLEKRVAERTYQLEETNAALEEEIEERKLCHHERVDGTGYPRGWRYDQIPVQSKILGLAESYDSMISERTYKNSMSEEEASIELMKHAGTQFDFEITKVFIEKVLNRKLPALVIPRS